MKFTPTEDFFSEQFDSQYCAGLQYTVRDDNPRLAKAVAQWLKDGKVNEISDSTSDKPIANMGGQGQVGEGMEVKIE